MNNLNKWTQQDQFDSLVTPQVVVHKETLHRNISSMAQFAIKQGLVMRPHIKTHKSINILHLQFEYGASGFTVAKLSEAEALLEAGFKQNIFSFRPSILIGFPIVGERNLARVKALQDQAEVILMADSLQHLQAYSAFAKRHHVTFSITIKINTGLNRCGLEPNPECVMPLLEEGFNMEGIRIIGMMTHAGHAYGATTETEVYDIALHEGQQMVELKQFMMSKLADTDYHEQLKGLTISVGSTPTVRVSGTVQGVDEIRPGNFVFHDRTQVHLGVARWEDCALRVRSRIVSHPTSNRWVIDAGAKTLGLDRGAHGRGELKGHGAVVGEPNLTLSRLSEEHGVLEGEAQQALDVGDVVEVIPNHACPVVNLTHCLHMIAKDGQESVWPVTATQRNY
ncbi:alanine racemase [Caldalkalibacillus salinus]|uniref:alanine racemase n=1 Tax=Caldalkalibacillus salinus TaxID=2803787 RepID=UPI001923BF37